MYKPALVVPALFPARGQRDRGHRKRQFVIPASGFAGDFAAAGRRPEEIELACAASNTLRNALA